MKLTKLPDVCDPSSVISKTMHRKFAVCPVCGESRSSARCLLEKIQSGEHYEGFLWGGVEKCCFYPCDKGWYGPAKGDILGIFMPWRWHHWHIDSYECHTCGAEWDSDPYPIDITGLN